eukprot:TRINITY_DN40611_c0_g1_i1.p1 TRINITY_DN40611_c0_g1~~TRINITY_DN40611_c0_g1_i1.p1  ORF type:complete len:448 (+),score=63.73 TRINITY_DN40611_c0_g1_i1:131-1474(+)
MAFLDGPAQIILLVVVFCCPLIPAGGWCWLKSIECCLACLGAIVRNARKFAYVPMYLCLLGLLLAGSTMVTQDFLHSQRTDEQRRAFYIFVGTAGLALLTILVSVGSTLKCLQGTGTLFISEQRERTVYILALPAFYCLMCFQSCQQILSYELNTVDKHWSWDVQFTTDQQRQNFTMDMVTFYMSAADVFEAFAFTFFGMLTMESLRRSSQYTARQGAREVRLQGCIQKWTMSPIYMFCAVLCLESVYRLLNVFTKYFHLTSIVPPALTHALERVPQPDSYVCSIAFFTLTSVFSSLAIMALFSIEHVFHGDLASVDFINSSWERCRFLSNLKFWGVKIFVTVEFALDMAMMLWKAEQAHKQLVFAAAMGLLCFSVSLLHIWAYAPSGRWIAEDTVGSEDLAQLDRNSSISIAATTASGVSLTPLVHSEGLSGSKPNTSLEVSAQEP